MIQEIGGKTEGYGFCSLRSDELSYKKILKNLAEVCECLFP